MNENSNTKALSQIKDPNMKENYTENKLSSCETKKKKLSTREAGTGRKSVKSGREPLKVLNVNENVPKNNLNKKVSSGKKSPLKTKSPSNTLNVNWNVSHKKSAKKSIPSLKKSSPKIKILNKNEAECKDNMLDVSQMSVTDTTPKKTKPTVPKIFIVYEDSPTKEEELEKKVEKEVETSNFPKEEKQTEEKENVAEQVVKPRGSPKFKPNRQSCSALPDAKLEKNPRQSKVRKSCMPQLKPKSPEFEKMLHKLQKLFPDIDPEYLKAKYMKFKGSLSETLEFFVNNENKGGIPTLADFVLRQETTKQEEKYLENFSVENFLKLFPNPWDYFLRSEVHDCASHMNYSIYYLKNKFKKHYVWHIENVLAKNEFRLYQTNRELNTNTHLTKMRSSNRSKFECALSKPLTYNIEFMHEVAFIENESEIKAHLKTMPISETFPRCQACNGICVLPEDNVVCAKEHNFCKDCLLKDIRTEPKKNIFTFECLNKCGGTIPPAVLRKTIETENWDTLTFCMLCGNIVTDPPEHNKIGLIESLRDCKFHNHTPFICCDLPIPGLAEPEEAKPILEEEEFTPDLEF